ncbi:unnamed protein product [Lactuca saligna]|uniref:Uncharacterized protein n=1 Tax=Lactuca saligna TaxID=75948 RepID=A0AA35Z5T9_LACSI|nr:unnamed protein product [Lactuca saligna]
MEESNPRSKGELWEEIKLFFEVDETGKQFLMNRLGILIRNFRRKLYAYYIKPNLGNTKKLSKISIHDRALITEKYDCCVTKDYESTKDVKVCSSDGTRGYTTLRRKLIEEKVISNEEMPPRSIMLCKGRESKGEFKDEDVKLMSDKLMEHEKQIKVGQLNVEAGTDALTLVFGKEKGGFLKGVGTEVTYNRYFNVPRYKGSSKEEIKYLKVAL